MENQGRFPRWKWIFIVAISVSFFIKTAPLAQAKDGYNFSWLDPDKKIYVLQNRKYEKARHLSITGMGGVGLSQLYRDAYNVEPRASFYFTEEWGVEAFYTSSFFKDNNAFEALKQASPNALPVVREMKTQYGGLIHFAPWYAKMNMFNQILYFDWYFSAGAGSMVENLDTNKVVGGKANIVSTNRVAFYIGTGHYYHLTETFFVRADLMAAFFRAPLFGTSGAETWFSNTNFNIGLGVRL